ncbi:hypothetical protein DEA98_09875 [Brucella pseudogrignonensis]|nr:hypothetical protein [Brucella pseudogrignonensis]
MYPESLVKVINTGERLAKVQAVFDIPTITGKILGIGHCTELAFKFDLRTPAPENSVYLAHISLVEGDATAEDDPFSPRHIQQETALCQRYYELVVGGYSGDTVSGSAYRGYIWPAVAKRAAPTILWHSAQAVFRFPGSVTIAGTTPLGAAAIEAVAGSSGNGSYFTHAIAFDAEL